MKTNIAKIQEEIAPFRDKILNHKVYQEITSIEQLSIFMKHHIFAVWDFMSLLKSLQINLTCTSIPWMPKGSPDTRFFINEIVTGEESDVDQHGNRMSHFEMYVRALGEIAGETTQITQFLEIIREGKSITDALLAIEAPQSVSNFVNHTFNVIEKSPIHVQAAVFTFGREDLIPDMFHAMIAEIVSKNPDKTETFNYYLERHIEVDGDHHSKLAIQLLEELCGEDQQKWEEIKIAAIESLDHRAKLWDGVYEELSVLV